LTVCLGTAAGWSNGECLYLQANTFKPAASSHGLRYAAKTGLLKRNDQQKPSFYYDDGGQGVR
jgi:hypothetical protein